MSTISYAHIAARGNNGSGAVSVKDEVSTVDAGDDPKVSNDSVDKDEANPKKTVKSNSDSKKSDVNPKVSKKSDNDSSDDKKSKKLAPAPVPQTNAWGSVSSITTVKSDELKWPTPSEDYKQKPVNNQKFIKPITKQWVPINAKLILPDARTENSGNQKKNPKKKKKKAVNGSTVVVKKDDNKEKEVKEKSVNNTPSPTFKSKPDSVSTNSDLSHISTERLEVGTNESEMSEPISNATSDVEKLTEDFKNFTPNNGFYQPQPYPMNYNNRQFRLPSNYRVNRFSLPNNYNGFIPMPYPPQPNQHHQSLPVNQYYPGANPQQFSYYNPLVNQQQFQAPIMVPPPISPKQDPITALIQQLDYYFSLENLIKDVYLRKNMNNEGYVALDFILEFKRVKLILDNIKMINNGNDFDQLVINSLNNCGNIEVMNTNDTSFDLHSIFVRVKKNWKQWVLDA